MTASTIVSAGGSGSGSGGGGPISRLLRRGRTGRTAIGIDVGTRSIKAVQLARPGDGKLRVVAAAIRPRAVAEPLATAIAPRPAADGNAQAAATAAASASAAASPITAEEAVELGSALAGAGFLGKRAVVAAPADAVLFASLELPARGAQVPLDQLARMEVARQFRCNPDSFEMDWWELPAGMRGTRGMQALAAALAHDRGNGLLDTFAHSSLDVEALDVEPAALVRACRPMLAMSPDGSPVTTAILDLGHGPATLSFVHCDILTFSRRIPEGAMRPLHEALCDVLAAENEVVDYLLGEIGLSTVPKAAPIDPDEEPLEMPEEGRRLIAGFADTLVKELTLSLSYARHQYPDAPVDRLLLVGGGAGTGGLVERLASALGVEVLRATPAGLAECDPGLLGVCSSPALVLAMGLAMHELPEGR